MKWDCKFGEPSRRLLDQPVVAKQISFRLANTKKSVTFNLAICLKIRNQINLFHSSWVFLHLPPILRYTEFANSCFIVYSVIPESFLTPVLSISILDILDV